MNITLQPDNFDINPLYFFNEEVPAHCLLFIQNENDGLLICGREDSSLSAWDLRTLRKNETFRLCAGPSQCISVNVCSSKLISQDKTGLVKFWKKSENWKEEQNLQLKYCGFCKLSVEPELQLVAFPLENCCIQVCNLNLECVSVLKPDESDCQFGHVMACKFSKYEGKHLLIVAYENGSIILWSIEGKNPVSVLSVCKSPLFALDFDDDSGRGICGSNTKKLSVFNIGESLSLGCIDCIRLEKPGVGCMKIHRTKDILVVGCWDGMIRIFSWTTLKLLSVLAFHSHGVEDLCFSSKYSEVFDSDGLLFAVSRDKKISIWKVPNLFVS